MPKRIAKTISLLLCVLLLAGCAGGQTEAPVTTAPPDDPGSDLLINGQAPIVRQSVDQVFSLNYDPDAPINPVRAESSANMQFWSLLYDSVFTVNEDFSVSSEIVREIRTDDYQWWVFDLNTDIRFSDGTPLTAQDVAYSIQRAQQTAYYRERLSIIYGVSALGADCFAISTAYADSQFPALLNIPIIKNGDYFEDRPLGSGPYMLDETRSALVPNPENRHRRELPVDIIYLRDFMDTSARITAFEDASIDIVTNDPTGMYNLGYGSSSEKRYYDTTNLHFIGFNMRSMYFQFFRARYALGFAIDREQIVNGLMGGCGVVTTLPVHPRSPLYDASYAATLAFDADKSAALFEAAGIGDLDADGALEILVTGIVVELDIKFIVNNDSTVKVEAARQICQRLNDMGITTTLWELSWDDYITALETGDYDMYYGEVRLGADWDLSYLFRVPESREDVGRNYAQCTDEAYCQQYAEYLAAPESERYDAFQRICRYVTEGGAILPICFERREILTHRGVVSGISATQFDLFHNFTGWTIRPDA